MLIRVVLSLIFTFCRLGSLYSLHESAEVQPDSILGIWSGSLGLGKVQIPIAISFKQDPQGLLQGSFSCAEYKLSELPLENIFFENGLLRFELPPIKASFKGALNQSELSGQFIQSGFRFPIQLKPVLEKPKRLGRPQEPIPPFTYRVEEVSFENKEANVILAGTLTLPHSEGPFPAVLLIAGSGPNDRNEEILGHKPFLVLADHLTRSGIAVLRFDKRGVGQSTGDYDAATTQDFAEDALDGLEYLISHSQIDPFHIGLIGHSEGAIISSILAAKSSHPAFIILLGGPGVTGEELLYEQGALMACSMGLSEELIVWEGDLAREMFAIIKNEPQTETAEELLKTCIASYVAVLPDLIRKELEEKYEEDTYSIHTQTVIDQINTPWFRYFLSCDPTFALRQIKIPVLVINGELDLQVAPYQNLPPIAKALEEGGNQNYKILELPTLNHLFQSCQTGAIEEYSKIEETISPIALNCISDWILSQI